MGVEDYKRLVVHTLSCIDVLNQPSAAGSFAETEVPLPLRGLHGAVSDPGHELRRPAAPGFREEIFDGDRALVEEQSLFLQLPEGPVECPLIHRGPHLLCCAGIHAVERIPIASEHVANGAAVNVSCCCRCRGRGCW